MPKSPILHTIPALTSTWIERVQSEIARVLAHVYPSQGLFVCSFAPTQTINQSRRPSVARLLVCLHHASNQSISATSIALAQSINLGDVDRSRATIKQQTNKQTNKRKQVEVDEVPNIALFDRQPTGDKQSIKQTINQTTNRSGRLWPQSIKQTIETINQSINQSIPPWIRVSAC